MISKLTIRGFQSHDENVIEFSPGVNIIIGQSDSGKTAVLRALDWVCNNRPQGDDFRRTGSKETEVSVVIDGYTITRRKKGTTENLYLLDGKPFKAFGASVPEEIQKVINMNDLNWQRQLDPPYLLSRSPGEIAGILNQIVNLEVIDTSLSQLNTLSRQVSQDIRSQEETLGDLQAGMEKFRGLASMEEKMDRIEDLEKTRETQSARVRRLQGIQEMYQENDNLLKESTRIIQVEKTLGQLESRILTRKDLSRKLDRLKRLQDELGEAIKVLEVSSPSEDCLRLLDRIETRILRVNKARTSLRLLVRYQVDLETAQGTLRYSQEQVQKYEKRLEGLKCPTCGRIMGDR